MTKFSRIVINIFVTMDKKNKRFQCEHYEKNYATIEGILKHSVSAHHMCYDRRNGRTISLTAIELSEEMKKTSKDAV